MFYEEDKYLKFYTYFRGIFNFDSGICFNPKSMGVKDKAELIGYTIWSLKKDKSEKNKRIVLQEKIQQTDDLVIDGEVMVKNLEAIEKVLENYQEVEITKKDIGEIEKEKTLIF